MRNSQFELSVQAKCIMPALNRIPKLISAKFKRVGNIFISQLSKVLVTIMLVCCVWFLLFKT